MSTPPTTKSPFSLQTLLTNFTIPSRFHDKRITSDTRNYLLVAATLVAAVTFQAGVNPPGGVWQDTKNCTQPSNATSDSASPPASASAMEYCQKGEKSHEAGRAIYSSEKVSFRTFLACNTLALGTAIHLIVFLTYEHPFFIEVLVATLSMAGTYVASITAVIPDKNTGLGFYCFILAAPTFIRTLMFFINKICIHRLPQDNQDDKENQSGINDVGQF